MGSHADNGFLHLLLMEVILSVSMKPKMRALEAVGKQFDAMILVVDFAAASNPALPSAHRKLQRLHFGCEKLRAAGQRISWIVKLVTKTVTKPSESLASIATTLKQRPWTAEVRKVSNALYQTRLKPGKFECLRWLGAGRACGGRV
jgi:hypothetical protein